MTHTHLINNYERSTALWLKVTRRPPGNMADFSSVEASARMSPPRGTWLPSVPFDSGRWLPQQHVSTMTTSITWLGCPPVAYRNYAMHNKCGYHICRCVTDGFASAHEMMPHPRTSSQRSNLFIMFVNARSTSIWSWNFILFPTLSCIMICSYDVRSSWQFWYRAHLLIHWIIYKPTYMFYYSSWLSTSINGFLFFSFWELTWLTVGAHQLG